MNSSRYRLAVLAAAFAGLSFAGGVSAQQPTPESTLVFHFEHPVLPVPEYTLTIHQDGTGSYTATYAPPPPDPKYGGYYAVSQPGSPTQLTRPILLSSQTTARLFERIRGTDRLHGGCESRARNIADTGSKTITYTDAAGTAQCTYNYTENRLIASLTETFQAIAQTLDEGHSIELKHRYDRLGLDRELALLADAVHDGRAVEVATIAPVLKSLCDDTQVMERVRKRAQGLLEASGANR